MGRRDLGRRAVRRCGIVAEIGWTLLATLLAGLLAAALLHDRSAWPGLVAGEATYLMQAESLVRDLDLTYSRADFDRLLLRRYGDPTDLDLVSGSEGRDPASRAIAFDRPFPYALYLAPFVAWRPENGFAVANALLLALVSLLAAKSLNRYHGAWAPLVVVALVFASVVFAYVFLATGDLFLFAVTVAAFCLLAPTAEAGGPAAGRRAVAAGALLAIPCATEPLTAPLLAAALLVPASGQRARVGRALAAGAVAMLAAVVAVRWLAGGGLPFAAAGIRFTPETGFPLVDFTAGEWPRAVQRLAVLEGEAPLAGGLALRGWSLVDLLVGRSIGLLPYFAPLILLLGGGGRRGGRRWIVAAAALWALAVLILRPDDVFGGPGAVANRLFLPVYGALWLAAGERGGGRSDVRRLLALGLALAIAAPFLGRLWSDPGAYPIAEGGDYRHPSALALEILPYETTQRRLPRPPGDRWAEHRGLWVTPLTDNVWAEARRRRLVADGGPADLLIASREPVTAFRLELERDAGPPPAGDGIIDGRTLSGNGGTSLRLPPRGLRRRHAVGRGGERRYLYRLTFELPSASGQPVGFRLRGEPPAPR